MSWAYGLIEEDGDLKLAEIYFNETNDIMFHVPINWNDIKDKRAKRMVLSDIKSQIKNNFCRFKYGKKKK